MKYLSSLPNMRRSVAFSLERSAIFSALSRSLWKLLWIFLIRSLLVENWAWMSAGRYSYRTDQFKFLNTGNCSGGNKCQDFSVICDLCDKPLPGLRLCWSWTHRRFSCKRHAAWSEHPVWGERGEECVSGKRHWSNWNRIRFTVSHRDDNALLCNITGQASVRQHKKTTYRATEGEESLDQLILWKEGVPCHQVNESAESTPPPFNELPLRDGGQDCGRTTQQKKKTVKWFCYTAACSETWIN